MNKDGKKIILTKLTIRERDLLTDYIYSEIGNTVDNYVTEFNKDAQPGCGISAETIEQVQSVDTLTCINHTNYKVSDLYELVSKLEEDYNHAGDDEYYFKYKGITFFQLGEDDEK